MIARHFPFFLAAAEEENFQRAAERLNIAQSALSRHISALEEDLGGIRLFERLPRGVRLTPSGALFLGEVRRILADLDEATIRVRRHERGQIGLIRIAFTEAVAARPLLADALRRFQGRFPDVQADLIAMVSKDQRSALRRGEIDVGFLYAEPGDEQEFATRHLMTDDFVLAAPRGHRLLALPEIKLSDLAGEPLIFPSRGHAPALYERMVAAFRSRNIVPWVVAENPSADILNCLVSAGIGLGFLITSQVERAPDDVALRPITDFSMPLPLVLGWLRDNRSPILPNFVEAVAAEQREIREVRHIDDINNC
jgi:DNA-binding transcriptional LysR family regulator